MSTAKRAERTNPIELKPPRPVVKKRGPHARPNQAAIAVERQVHERLMKLSRLTGYQAGQLATLALTAWLDSIDMGRLEELARDMKASLPSKLRESVKFRVVLGDSE